MIDINLGKVPNLFCDFAKSISEDDIKNIEYFKDFIYEHGTDCMTISEHDMMTILFDIKNKEDSVIMDGVDVSTLRSIEKQFILFYSKYTVSCLNATRYIKSNAQYSIVLFSLQQNIRLLIGFTEQMTLNIDNGNHNDNPYKIKVENEKTKDFLYNKLNKFLEFLLSDYILNKAYYKEFVGYISILKLYTKVVYPMNISELKDLLINTLNCCKMLIDVYNKLNKFYIDKQNEYISIYSKNPLKLNIILNPQDRDINTIYNYNWYLSEYDTNCSTWVNTDVGGWSVSPNESFMKFVDNLFVDYVDYMRSIKDKK